ncbi:MAG: GH92 family glycosyl hydrolase [Flavisolibacter sp.]
MFQLKLKNIVFPCILLFGFQIGNTQNLLKYVQPLSGTAPSTTPSSVKHSEAGSERNANTIPAVCLPFGMTQWTPQTNATENKCIPPYEFLDTLFSGFRGTHWINGSCMQDYGSFTIMPITGRLKTADYAIPFPHNEEASTPSYYKLTLPFSVSEITATLRCAMLRITMLRDDSLYLLIIPNSDTGEGSVGINRSNQAISGYNTVHRIYQGWGQPAGFNGWFFVKCERSFSVSGTFTRNGVFSKDSIQNKKGVGAYVGFYLKKGEQLQIRVGTSFSSVAGAVKNLHKELPTWDFNDVVTKANQSWNQALSQIRIETKSEKDKRIFYTALYHSFLHPRLFSDVDGTFPRFSSKYQLEKMADGDYYDDFSMWDIYRAQLPLLEILQPSLTNQFVRSMILKGQQGGWLPIFPCWNNYTAAMIGDHVTAFIASAYNKGIRNYNLNAAYALMRKNAFETPRNFDDYKDGLGRRALTSYLKYGFIPLEDSVPFAFHKKEQVSRTLEYAFDDYALSTIAKALGEKGDYHLLRQRSLNYRNVFNTSVKMVRGRFANGTWASSFHADERESYITEGTPRQYTFYVPHDVKGLIHLMGGIKSFETALDSLFLKNEYWHGNEPGHQIPFLYDYTDAPWKTQQQVRKILNEEYSDGAGGLSGNDDAGQMSAWYVFAALGFYPVNPVSDEYLISSPLFDKTSINVGGQKPFEIIVHKTSKDAIFIQKMKWNNEDYNKYSITHSMIVHGGLLEIWLDERPAGNYRADL